MKKATVGVVAGVAVLTLGAGTALARDEVRRESGADMRGVSVLVGGGVEGYTSSLGSNIRPGAAYGATLMLRPSKVLGVELGYSGAANNFNRGTVATSGTTRGPDVMRNGAQAVATLGLTAAPLQPYVLAGVGLSRYNVRAEASGFQDDTVGNVPLGGGLRLHIGDFTADARVNYNVLLDQQFATAVPSTTPGTPVNEAFSNGGTYTGTLNLGATF
ncbi:outer membrane beta-barrel protein [Cystobacter fuscus]|uniref:outer membrane beta-barrel protein n=1 Tax=Cystobacter fuscus TaxID=43 RepID=UPI0005BC3E69|nr:outer membrane beta-barrel protein [Cystobacter fuscus]